MWLLFFSRGVYHSSFVCHCLNVKLNCVSFASGTEKGENASIVFMIRL